MLDLRITRNCVDLNYCMGGYRSHLDMRVGAEELASLMVILTQIEDGKPTRNALQAAMLEEDPSEEQHCQSNDNGHKLFGHPTLHVRQEDQHAHQAMCNAKIRSNQRINVT